MPLNIGGKRIMLSNSQYLDFQAPIVGNLLFRMGNIPRRGDTEAEQ